MMPLPFGIPGTGGSGLFGPMEPTVVNSGLISSVVDGVITFPNVRYGADPGPNRTVMVMVSASSTSGNNDLSATVVWGGVPISRVVEREDNASGKATYVGLFSAVVPDGVSGLLEVTLINIGDLPPIALDFTMVSTMVTDQLGSPTVVDFGEGDSSDEVNLRINVPSGGLSIFNVVQYNHNILGGGVHDRDDEFVYIGTAAVSLPVDVSYRHLVYFSYPSIAIDEDNVSVRSAEPTKINVVYASWL